MGEVVTFAKPVTGGEIPPVKRKPEPKGFLLVPARILEPLEKLQASMNRWGEEKPGGGYRGLDFDAYYRVLALIEMAARYEQ